MSVAPHRWMLLTLAALALFAVSTPPAESATAQPAPISPRSSRDTTFLPTTPGCTVDPNRELFIRDLSVVNDCYRTTWTGLCAKPAPPATRGAWTFGKLMEGLAGTTDPVKLSDFTLAWLKHWTVDLTINSDPVPQRPNIQTTVIQPWLTASGGVTLDMKKAPFRLLAIVARLDLRQNSGYSGGGTTAGEGRFVFNLLDSLGNTTQFLAILEYGLDARACTDVQAWASSWHGLGSIPFGPTYNAALQQITDQFSRLGASPAKPNGSALNQARTNEIALTSPWELREFKLVASADTTNPAPLTELTVAQTPANSHQHSQLLANFINQETPAILAGQHVVPLTFQNTPFRGGASRHSLDFNWDGPQPPNCGAINTPEARHIVSRDTCNGCHGGETGTIFKHVEPRQPNQVSALSAFLTGTGPLTDICGLKHTFGDIERRRVDLCQLLAKSCTQIDAEPAVTFVH
ncbi:MAG: hypothetical protein ABJC13_01645 [Acidobacteriota bacterium]